MISLGRVISFLESRDPNEVFSPAFGAPSSWRGDYYQIAFAPLESSTAGEMLKHAKYAVGRSFVGWKGGEFEMDLFSRCHIAEPGMYRGDDDAIAMFEVLFQKKLGDK